MVETEEDVIKLLQFYHSSPMGGHSGINNTLEKLSRFYYWPGISADVEEYVSVSS